MMEFKDLKLIGKRVWYVSAGYREPVIETMTDENGVVWKRNASGPINFKTTELEVTGFTDIQRVGYLKEADALEEIELVAVDSPDSLYL